MGDMEEEVTVSWLEQRGYSVLLPQVDTSISTLTAEVDTTHHERSVIATRLTGIVKWFNVKHGYGYITSDISQEDVLVHHSAIIRNNPRKKLRSLGEGERVEFDIVESDKGKEAANVTGPDFTNVQGSKFAWNIGVRKYKKRVAGSRHEKGSSEEECKIVSVPGDHSVGVLVRDGTIDTMLGHGKFNKSPPGVLEERSRPDSMSQSNNKDLEVVPRERLSYVKDTCDAQESNGEDNCPKSSSLAYSQKVFVSDKEPLYENVETRGAKESESCPLCDFAITDSGVDVSDSNECPYEKEKDSHAEILCSEGLEFIFSHFD